MSTAVQDDATIVVRETDLTEQEEIAAALAKAGDVQMIPVGLIEKSEIALRGCNRQSEEFQLLLRSIQKKGVLNSILVRKFETGGVVKYGLIDGLQRFTASQDLGLEYIPARIVEMEDAELLEAQIITNVTRVQTKPAELSKHLLRILSRNPLMTKAELADKCCQSLSWVEQRLSLNKLKEEIQELVNAGRIHLTNAYALSKIPEDEQPEHVDAAMTEPPATFVGRMKSRVKDIRDAKNKGRDAGKAEFKPTQHLQKVAAVKTELAVLNGDAKGDSAIILVLQKNGVKVDENVRKAVLLTTAWMLNYDPQSQDEQRKKNEAREKRRKEEQARQKTEREKQREKEAAEKAADIMSL